MTSLVNLIQSSVHCITEHKNINLYNILHYSREEFAFHYLRIYFIELLFQKYFLWTFFFVWIRKDKNYVDLMAPTEYELKIEMR